MSKDRISELTMDFAVEIVRLSQDLEDRHEYVLSRQIRSSGGSIGANVRESKYAQSRPDFVSKLQIALKEAGETDFWLELLRIMFCNSRIAKHQSSSVLRLFGYSFCKE